MISLAIAFDRQDLIALQKFFVGGWRKMSFAATNSLVLSYKALKQLQHFSVFSCIFASNHIKISHFFYQLLHDTQLMLLLY